MIYKEILNIIFRLINFAILILIFTHGFRTYFYQDFKAQVRKNLDWWLALRNNIMQMRIKQKELDGTIADEQWHAERLLDNLSRWQAWNAKEHLLKKQLIAARNDRMQERRILQEKHYQETLFARQVVPKLLIRVQHELYHDYATHKWKAGMFIDKTIDLIKNSHD